MRKGARRNLVKNVLQSECFLTVSQSGLVSGDKRVREDIAGLETWKCEYLGDRLRVQKLYPSPGASLVLRPDPQQIAYIEMRYINRLTAEILHEAKHEAGHAVLLYALKLWPVRYIDLGFTIIPGGNLHAQIENRQPLHLRIVRGATANDVRVQDLKLNSVMKLAAACEELGGIAGCQGNESGAENDLAKANTILASIPELARTSNADLDQTVFRLRDELKLLANEIITDPVVAPRHAELAKTVCENGYLDRIQIEKILDPATLSSYSARIEAIGKKFDIPPIHEDREHGLWSLTGSR